MSQGSRATNILTVKRCRGRTGTDGLHLRELTAHSEPGGSTLGKSLRQYSAQEGRETGIGHLCDQGLEMHYTTHLSQVQMLTDSESDERIQYSLPGQTYTHSGPRATNPRRPGKAPRPSHALGLAPEPGDLQQRCLPSVRAGEAGGVRTCQTTHRTFQAPRTEPERRNTSCLFSFPKWLCFMMC